MGLVANWKPRRFLRGNLLETYWLFEMTPQPTSSTAPTPASGSQIEDNWLAWLDNPSKADLEWLEQQEQRAKRVGALLHELRCLTTSKPPRDWRPKDQTEAQFWIDYARSAPGLSETGLQAAVERIKTEAASHHAGKD